MTPALLVLAGLGALGLIGAPEPVREDSKPAVVEPGPEHPTMRLSVLAGSLASLSADASGVTPLARLAVDSPLSTKSGWPSLHVVADLSALPGESLEVQDPSTFRAIEFSAALSQPLHERLRFSLYAEAGFASRLPGDTRPRDRAPRWGSLGFRVATSDRGHLTIGAGGDQRLSGQWVPAVQVAGAVQLLEVFGGRAFLVGSAVLGLDVTGSGPDTRDVIRVGLAIGR